MNFQLPADFGEQLKLFAQDLDQADACTNELQIRMYLMRALKRACRMLRVTNLEELRKFVDEKYEAMFEGDEPHTPFRFFDDYFSERGAFETFLAEIEDQVFRDKNLDDRTRQRLLELLRFIWLKGRQNIETPCPSHLIDLLTELRDLICRTSNEAAQQVANDRLKVICTRFLGFAVIAANVASVGYGAPLPALAASAAIGTVVLTYDKYFDYPPK